MNVAFYSTKSYDRQYFDRLGKSYGHNLLYLESRLNRRTASLVAGGEAVCIFVNDDASAEVLERLKEEGVNLIALRCAGFNNVDLPAAKKLGIRVVRVPAYSPHAVAEHAVAIILTLNRKTHKAYNRVREGNFSLERLTGFDLYGKTVHVIGTGRIGQNFALIMKGFGCQVLASDPYPNMELKAGGVPYVELEEGLSGADIVSLHCPLTPESQHLINAQTLELMKDGCMLINTSRGGLVDTEAAIAALRSGKLGYMGIDVYEQEEHLFFRDLSESILQDEQITQLMTFPNVLITSHQSFFTAEALEEITKVTLDNLTAFAQGKEMINEISAD